MANLSETCSVVDELTSVFASPDDDQLLSQVMSLRAEVERGWAAKEAQIDDVINELNGAISKLQSEISSSPEDKYIEELARVEAEKMRLRAQIADLHKQKKTTNDRLLEVQQEDEELQRLSNEQSSTANIELPHVKHLINLYSCISNITWDFDSANDVKGTMFLTKRNEARPFLYKATGALSPPQIVNAIWDLMWLDQVTA